MISIKRFLDERLSASPPPDSLLEASMQMGRLLLDGLARHMVRGRQTDSKNFDRTLGALMRKMQEPPSALNLLSISSEAVEALETYAGLTTEYFREENEQMQSMVAMLADTVADISGQTDASVTRLQSIEQQLERASGLDDIKALSASLQSCLLAVREAAALQRGGSAATVGRLEQHIDVALKRFRREHPQPRLPDSEIALEPETAGLPAAIPASYVAAFKLQRAEHIATRFGEKALYQMLTVISQSLKRVLGPNDRLLRWKGTSFVMFLTSAETIREVRVRLSAAVATTGQHYIEVGKKTALLSVGVDWTVFPQAQFKSLDAVFAEVDLFLANKKPEIPAQIES